METKAWDNSEF